ncbi:capsular polysaccharide synthesis protein [Mesorhizobium sp. M0276]|uniref:capsular polysaccharide synthesis protein n=1 Tax=Mesorhizobium sp. M0276 TaxID=2956928 RepID=UPI003337F359
MRSPRTESFADFVSFLVMAVLQKTIWTCWFQGRDQAPEVVRKCIASWETKNPQWDFRCLDAGSIERYVNLGKHVDLSSQTITAASLSDILRLLLLHEYGGVWVDATTYCHMPLDDWLPLATSSGFFAFSKPAEDRELASWFLAAHVGSALLDKWVARTIAYWRGRRSTRDYFWLHHLFGELCATDPDANRLWQKTPRISADGPHSVQNVGMYKEYDLHKDEVDWTAPVFKLTHRVEADRLGGTTLVGRLLGVNGEPSAVLDLPVPSGNQANRKFGILSVATENLGDHIQILAGEALMRRAGFEPSFLVDRDNGIAHPPPAPPNERVGILLNGWFKTNPAEWPPHQSYDPIYLGFHIRLFQSPSLVAPAAIEYYSKHGPIGCRDNYTLALLKSYGLDAFLSHCLTLTFTRRTHDPENQDKIFVVSRDKRILDYLPSSLGDYEFISHYSGEHDFLRNKARAEELLEKYRKHAKLIVTTLLHCALPAIAMGIPVVVFYPLNDELGRRSDRERLSSLAAMVRIHELNEVSLVDWSGTTIDIGSLKLALIDQFFSMAERWGSAAPPRIEGIAPSSTLPPILDSNPYRYLDDPERLGRLAKTGSPDRERWGALSSYKADWSMRGEITARFIPDGARILEIGTGTGAFRRMVMDRCHYSGADLSPLDQQTLVLNLENDPIPPGDWDAIVLLGVIEYLHDPLQALTKVSAAARMVILSYCVPRNVEDPASRRARGWVNELTERDLISHLALSRLSLKVIEPVNSSDDFDQKLFVFERAPFPRRVRHLIDHVRNYFAKHSKIA